MIKLIASWFVARSGREQWLLGTAAGLGALVIVVYGLLLPGYAAIVAAEKELDVAIERRGHIVARAGTKSAVSANTAGLPGGSGDSRAMDAIIGESAAAGGFEITNGSASGPDEFAFRLASVKAGPLLVWLTALEAQRIEIAEIRMRKGEGGFVAADIRLRKIT